MRRLGKRTVTGVILALLPVAFSIDSFAESGPQARVVMLGTGTPIPDPASSGPAVAITVNGMAYLFDAGAGVVRRAQQAAEKFKIDELQAFALTRLFLTHLHSDHTLGYPDVILTPWVIGRSEPLEVYGPKGTGAMTASLKQAYREDIEVRSHGLEELSPSGLEVKVHEIEPGMIYEDKNLSVRAIAVRHGSWKSAFGYAVKAGKRSIVISGDTAPCPELMEACHGCDVLIHEVYSAERFASLPASAQRYHSSFHTSTRELAALATQAKPKLLVLYHQLYFGPKEGVDLVKEVHAGYKGPVVSAQDLDAY